MRFKVDENLPAEAVELLRNAGHDAVSVLDQDLGGADDQDVAQISSSEDRALMTLDLDFSDIRAYPPSEHAGLVVLRLRDPSKFRLLSILQRTLPMFEHESLSGTLWILEEDRVRVRQ